MEAFLIVPLGTKHVITKCDPIKSVLSYEDSIGKSCLTMQG